MTRSIFAVALLLSVVLALILGVHTFAPEKAAGLDAIEPFSAVRAAASTSLSKTQVDQIVMGKAVFRTSSREREKVVDELGRYELKGTSVRGGRYNAYIRDVKQGKMLVKAIGDTLGLYEITEINDEGVTLRRGAEVLLLSKG